MYTIKSSTWYCVDITNWLRNCSPTPYPISPLIVNCVKYEVLVGKLPASITGDANSINGHDSDYFDNKISDLNNSINTYKINFKRKNVMGVKY